MVFNFKFFFFFLKKKKRILGVADHPHFSQGVAQPPPDRPVWGWLNHPRGPWGWFGHPQRPEPPPKAKMMMKKKKKKKKKKVLVFEGGRITPMVKT
jgi:hypothetical protein